LLNSLFPYLFGKELKEHVLVNNWANGWVLDNNDSPNHKFITIFWPQYLEYLGFAILIFTFAGILFLKKSKNQHRDLT